jgi:ABC-type spermidine/putrescine transport system permease subunit II
MIPAELAAALLHALAATALAALAAVPLAIALARLPASGAATLATALLFAALLPLPGAGTPPADAVPLLPFVALPLGWGLRRIPAATRRIAASLGSPVFVFGRLWLLLAAPWLLAGLALGFARALAGAGLAWPAALLAAAAWPALRALAAREGS